MKTDALAVFDKCHGALSAGRQVTVAEGLVREVWEGGAVSRYTYLRDGDLSSISEPDGTRWDYGYGTDGRLVSVAKNGESWARYRYDAAGRLLEVERPDGPRQHSYDAAGRLVRTLRGDASAFAYRYHDDGRVAVARSDWEESRFRYDEKGRVVRSEQVVEGIAIAVEMTFDAAGRLARMHYAPWDLSVLFTWDESGRPLSVAWQDQELARFTYTAAEKYSACATADGLREEAWHDPHSGRLLRKRLCRAEQVLWETSQVYGAGFRIEKEGARSYRYDDSGRLAMAEDGAQSWRFEYDAMDNLRPAVAERPERAYRRNQAGEIVAVLDNGELRAELTYDHKGRLLLKKTPAGSERFFYGPDDSLLAISDAAGTPRWLFVRLPTGLVAAIDFRTAAAGAPLLFHGDGQGNLVFAGTADGAVEGPLSCDPFGLPQALPARLPFFHKERIYHPELGLYWIGCRFYDPAARRFLSADSYTGAPDDERLVNPFRPAATQRLARAQILGEWLKQPRVRNRFAYCQNDPINRFDPNGHWSFGGVLLSILGAIWTLPNTLFGLVVEITCLVGEVVRWLVWLCSLGHVTWETPGIDGAASGRLNAFALVFTGGWLGSFESLLGITFGNVIFINRKWKERDFFRALPDQVSPPAYRDSSVTIPKNDVLYEHELRHVNQYAWFGPFFHLGLPLFGVYEWDVIFHGYQNAWLERNARDYGGL